MTNPRGTQWEHEAAVRVLDRQAEAQAGHDAAAASQQREARILAVELAPWWHAFVQEVVEHAVPKFNAQAGARGPALRVGQPQEDRVIVAVDQEHSLVIRRHADSLYVHQRDLRRIHEWYFELRAHEAEDRLTPTPAEAVRELLEPFLHTLNPPVVEGEEEAQP